MKGFRVLFLAALAAFGVASSFAQAWTSAYEAGLKAVKAGQWADARTDFLKAVAYRPEDASAATLLPGPVTERRSWRNGAPYSPNFLAAYAGYKTALTLAPGDAQNDMLKTAAGELEVRLSKGQQSRPTYYLLTTIYGKLGDTAKRDAAAKAFADAGDKVSWKIDTDGIAPEDLGQIQANSGGPTRATTGPGGTTPIVKPDSQGNIVPTSLTSVVTSIPTKFALIIGNSESRLPGDNLPYAGDDAQLLRQALVANGGYLDSNVDVVVNATADQLLTSAKALASRMPNGATLFIFYAGKGVNIAGKDYLAGVDTASTSDTTSMTAKSDLFDLFIQKSAKVFCFFEVSRPLLDGRFFGTEMPNSGQVAQMNATSEGSVVSSIYRDGKQAGVFVDAFIDVLDDLKSNGIPILEFGWQVFYKMRHGNTGQNGGGSSQTPSLPVLSHMASDARF